MVGKSTVAGESSVNICVKEEVEVSGQCLSHLRLNQASKLFNVITTSQLNVPLKGCRISKSSEC